MEMVPVGKDDLKLEAAIGEIARGCGSFAVECSDVGGKVVEVGDKIIAQASLLDELREAATGLRTEQEQVTEAAAEAREYATQARGHLEASKPVVDGAIETFAGLTELVLRLGKRMDNLEEALREVQAVALTIDQIGRQTNLLALNATLEAARAGEAGRGFAVVAGEVKKLASDTRSATERIARTIKRLNEEARGIGDEIDAGVASGGEARARTAELANVLGETLVFVDALDTRSGNIAEGSLAIRRNVQDFEMGLTSLSGEAQANSQALAEASNRLGALERISNGLLNLVSSTGVRTADTPFIETARRLMLGIRLVTEAAIDEGRLSIEDVFDRTYVPIAGSNPEQFMTRFVTFADVHVRPLLDGIVAGDGRVLATAIVDANGFLPTHIGSRSLPQGPDPLWNAEHCRNRRFFMDEQTALNLKSDAPFIVETYRQDLGGGRYRPVKSICLPFHVKGRRWGNLEFAYLD
jgi:methyl-accepting chemotaxis protein